MDIKNDIKARNVLRVALYVRVSSQDQVDNYSIGEQTERLQKYCEAMRWEVYKIYVDPGYSGGNLERPGLKNMIQDIENDLVDQVVVYKLDRLSRSQFDTLYLLEKVFIANDTDLVSMTENFSTSSSLGKAMIGFLAIFAQLEKDKINERMMMGKEARAKEGKWNGGTEPIGYDYNVADDMLYPNEYEQIQIKELRELFLKGTPLRTVETIFREKGYKHKHGIWDPKAMRRVLRSKLYLGYISYHGEWYKGIHESTLDEETYNKIITLLDARAEAYKESGIKPGAQTTYLGGILHCKKCGAKYCKNDWKQRNGNKTELYTCYSRSKKVKKMIKDPNCKNKNWKRAELDNIILGEIKKLKLDPDYFNQIRSNKKEAPEVQSKIDILKAEIEKIDFQISRFMDLYGIGKFTIDQVTNKVDPLNEQKTALEKEIKALTRSAGELTEEEALIIIEKFDEIIERNNYDEIRLMIDSLIYYIELDDEDIFIHWKFA